MIFDQTFSPCCVIVDQVNRDVRMPVVQNFVSHNGRFCLVLLTLLGLASNQILSQLVVFALVLVQSENAMNNLKIRVIKSST